MAGNGTNNTGFRLYYLIKITSYNTERDLLMEEYLSTLGDGTARAYKEDLGDFSRWFEECNDQASTPAIITAIDLREYQSHMLTVRGLKPSTINRRLAAIRAWLRWVKNTGDIQELPRFPHRITEPKVAPKALDKIEDARFLRAVERAGKPRDSALIALLRYAGLRVGEAVQVRPTDIKIGEKKGRVAVRAGKGMKRREVPLGAEARNMIKPWLSIINGEWLFPGRNNRHLSVRAVQDMINKYAYLAHLENVTPHVLRHTFATRLLRSKVDIVEVATLLGHSRLDTTARYTQPSWRDLERAVEDE